MNAHWDLDLCAGKGNGLWGAEKGRAAFVWIPGIEIRFTSRRNA